MNSWVLVLMILIFSCQNFNSGGEVKKDNETEIFHKNVSIEEFVNIWNENKKDKDYVLIDVRTQYEFKSGHIEGALLIDINSDSFDREISKLDKNKVYLLYCRSANRSSHAMSIMKGKGFTRVYNMQGGMLEYERLNFPVNFP